MTHFALKVIEISGSLQQSLHTVTTVQALGAIEDCCFYMCLPSIPFPAILIHKFKIFSWSYMTGHDGLRWHWALHFLCHRAVHKGRKQFSWHHESLFLQRLLRYLYTARKEESRFTVSFGFYLYKLKWSIKCRNINAVFCVCESKSCSQDHHIWKVHCQSKEIMNHAKNPSGQKLRHNLPIYPEKCAKGAQMCHSETLCGGIFRSWSEDKQGALIMVFPV